MILRCVQNGENDASYADKNTHIALKNGLPIGRPFFMV